MSALEKRLSKEKHINSYPVEVIDVLQEKNAFDVCTFFLEVERFACCQIGNTKHLNQNVSEK
jgi:hypothetical protein